MVLYIARPSKYIHTQLRQLHATQTLNATSKVRPWCCFAVAKISTHAQWHTPHTHTHIHPTQAFITIYCASATSHLAAGGSFCWSRNPRQIVLDWILDFGSLRISRCVSTEMPTYCSGCVSLTCVCVCVQCNARYVCGCGCVGARLCFPWNPI